MAATLKKLYQGQLPNTITTLYTAPAATRALVKGIRVVNTDTGASHYFSLYDGGTNAANKILGQIALQPNETYFESEFLVIEPAGTIRAVADAASSLSITIYGVELT